MWILSLQDGLLAFIFVHSVVCIKFECTQNIKGSCAFPTSTPKKCKGTFTESGALGANILWGPSIEKE